MFYNSDDGCTILNILKTTELHFKKMTFMVCGFYLNNTVIKTKSQEQNPQEPTENQNIPFVLPLTSNGREPSCS